MNNVQVYKFGGASIATIERMQQLIPIVKMAKGQLVIVVSALGKTTNALEEVVKFSMAANKEAAIDKIKEVETIHNQYATQLLSKLMMQDLSYKLNEFYTELYWAIEDAGIQSDDYVYDQIVCIGEMLSSSILSAFLTEQGITNKWMDARDLIKTDDKHREPEVKMEYTAAQLNKLLVPMLQKENIVVTQGFIGSTSDNSSVTLGREGSDYTAAILGSLLNASAVSIWKDVEGLKNADPKKFPNTVKIDEITYHEVIEMAYYGAQIIHPKTIKPLQNTGIPLWVKCFLNPSLSGTVVKEHCDTFIYPPIIALKKNQVLLQITSLDFSFITEDNISKLYDIFHRHHTKINLQQNAAISLIVCIDNNAARIKEMIEELEINYKVVRNTDVQLLTIRHYTTSVLEEMTKGRVVILEQKTRKTVQVVIE